MYDEEDQVDVLPVTSHVSLLRLAGSEGNLTGVAREGIVLRSLHALTRPGACDGRHNDIEVC